MPRAVNLIDNPTLQGDKAVPHAWKLRTSSSANTTVDTANSCFGGPCRLIRNKDLHGEACFEQSIGVEDDRRFRIEVIAAAPESWPDHHGLFIEIQAGNRTSGSAPVLFRQIWSDLARVPKRFQTRCRIEPEVQSITVRVGLQGAGDLQIHRVELYAFEDRREQGHVLANPHPGFACPPPHHAKRVAIVGAKSDWTSLTSLLEASVGSHRVTLSAFDDQLPADPATAVIIPGDRLPRQIATLDNLLRYAASHVTVISLAALAESLSRQGSLRYYRGRAELPCAMVMGANHVTQGLALRDVFPWSVATSIDGSFGQRQWGGSDSDRSLFEKYRFHVLLESHCLGSTFNENILCLYRGFEHGALIVMDLDPIEALPTSLYEGQIPALLLLNALGLEPVGLGQYVASAHGEDDLSTNLAELALRYPEVGYEVPGPPESGACGAAIRIPRRPQHEHHLRSERPIVRIRTVPDGIEHVAIWGTFTWVRHLLRGEPFTCPYAGELLRRYQIQWEVNPGAANQSLTERNGENVDTAPVACAITIGFHDEDSVRVTCAGAQSERIRRWLPCLHDALIDGRYVCQELTVHHESRALAIPGAPGPGGDSVAPTWMRKRIPLIIDDALGSMSQGAAATSVGVLIPRSRGDLGASSIASTDLVASLIELLMGFQLGMTAVNRRATAVAVRIPQEYRLNDGVLAALPGQIQRPAWKRPRTNERTINIPGGSWLFVKELALEEPELVAKAESLVHRR